MEVLVKEYRTGNAVEGKIQNATFKDMPLKKHGWQFTWKKLCKTEGSELYKLILKDSTSDIQGIVMISLMFDEMLYMNNIEVAPHNLGLNGMYDSVAGCLIAYACRRSFEIGKNNYKGYLTFESKSELISLYQKKYGATQALGNRMFIDPNSGIELINKFLKVQ